MRISKSVFNVFIRKKKEQHPTRITCASSYNHLVDSIMSKMILQAKHRILVADHSKFGRVAFAHIADLNAFDTLITDDYADNREYYEKIRAMGVNVITV